MNPWLAVSVFAFVGAAVPLSMVMASWMLRPSPPGDADESKRATYESGEVPTGTARLRFNIQYYMVALLFVVFDIETVLIFPWTVVYRSAVAAVGIGKALLPMLAFIGVLVVGLAWAWRNGAVEWARSPRADRAGEARRAGRTRRGADRTNRRARADRRRAERERERDRDRPTAAGAGAGGGTGAGTGPSAGPGAGTDAGGSD